MKSDLLEKSLAALFAFERAPFAATIAKLPDGVILEVNQEFEKIFGFTRDEVVGKTSLELGINPNSELRRNVIEQLLRDGRVRNIEIPLVLKNGDNRRFLINIDVIQIDDHKYILQTAQDITVQRQLEEEKQEDQEALVEGYAKALELKNVETSGHARRVVKMVVALSKAMGFENGDLLHVKRGALLHDIGKMGIPDNILLKEGPLTESEWDIMKTHAQKAYDLLSSVKFLQPALDIPYCHHEHWDGSGYPRGLRGEEIPIFARIFSVVDAWDAVTSDRSYRKAWDRQRAVEYILENSGTLFDPNVVNVFINNIEKVIL